MTQECLTRFYSSLITLTHHSSLITSLGSKSVSVFTRDDKCFHHLSVDEITVELVQFAQPKIVTGVIRIGVGVWIPS